MIAILAGAGRNICSYYLTRITDLGQQLPLQHLRQFTTANNTRAQYDMSLFKKITAPNGQKYEQPLGLFINGEVVPATGGKTIASIDPA